MKHWHIILCIFGLVGSGCVDEEPAAEWLETSNSGLSKGNPGAQNGDTDYCNDPNNLCTSGEGDCDSNSQCEGALVCGRDNGPKFGFGAKWDVCVPAHCENGQLDLAQGETLADCGGPCGTCPGRTGNNGDRDYCDDPTYPCGAGEGDCDSSSQCAGALICGRDNGPKFGMPRGYDVCIPASCQNGQIDAGELDADCGGVCGTCPFPNHCYNDQIDVGDGELGLDCGGPCEPCAALSLTVDSPADGELYRVARPVFSGQANAAQLVELELDGASLATVVANASGQWEYAMTQDIADGPHALTVTVMQGMDQLQETRQFDVDVTSTGAHLTSATYGGNSESAIYEVAVDDSSNTYWSGFFAGSADFGGGSMDANARNDGIVAKYDPSGQLLWTRTFGVAGRTKPRTIALHPSGGVVVAGYFSGSVDFGQGVVNAQGGRDAFVMHLNDAGVIQWVNVYGDAADVEIDQLAVDSTGSFAFIGQFKGNVDFGQGQLTSAGDYDVLVAKINAGGTTVWSKRFGGAARDAGYGIAFAPDGTLVVGGLFRNSVDFGGGPIAAATGSPGRHSAFLAGYAADGTHRWSRRIGGKDYDAVRSVAIDSNGDVIAGGYFYFTGDFGGGPIAAQGGYDLFLAKYDNLGEHKWSQAFDVSEFDEVWQLRVDDQDNILSTGVFRNTATFGGPALVSDGPLSSFIAKHSRSGQHIWSQSFGGDRRVDSYSLAIGPSGITVGGFFEGTANFGDGDVSALGYRNMFLKRVAP